MLSGFTDAKATALSTSHVRQAGSKSQLWRVFLRVWEKCLRREEEEECIRCEFSYFSFFLFSITNEILLRVVVLLKFLYSYRDRTNLPPDRRNINYNVNRTICNSTRIGIRALKRV